MFAEGNIKLNTNDENGYKILTNALKDINLEWNSFEDKQSKPVKVVVRKLHKTKTNRIIF